MSFLTRKTAGDLATNTAGNLAATGLIAVAALVGAGLFTWWGKAASHWGTPIAALAFAATFVVIANGSVLVVWAMRRRKPRVVLTIDKYEEMQRDHRQTVEDLKEARGIWTGFQSQYQIETTELERERDTAEAKLAAAEAELDKIRRIFRLAALEDEEVPFTTPISADHLPAIVISLHGLRPSLVALFRGIRAVWGAVRGEATKQSEVSPCGWLAAYVRAVEYAQLNAACGELQATLDRKADPGSMIVVAYYSYRRWRFALNHLAATLGRRINEVEGYEEWRAAEIALAEKLSDKLAPPELRDVRALLEVYEQREGALADPPQPLDTAALGEYGQRVEALLLLTRDERAFLRLFSLDPMPMTRADLLPSAIYNGGEALARRGVLVQRSMDGPVVRFCVPELTKRAWRATVSDPNEGIGPKTCIDIDLQTVAASSAAGTGIIAS